MYQNLDDINKNIIACKKCPRLTNWIYTISKKKTSRFMNETYWAKPVPSFGDKNAELLIVGLAPGAHGANRTGRMFTGDRSGEWLYRALYESGFSNKQNSVSLNDGMELKNCWITAAVHCAPPSNKPNIDEIRNCQDYLLNEILLLENLKVLLALGKIAFESLISVFLKINWIDNKKNFTFLHGSIYNLNNNKFLISSYHPSQQNTFTGKLTNKMFSDIFNDINNLLKKNL